MVRPRPESFQSPYQTFSIAFSPPPHCKQLTALLITMLSGLIFEWIIRADVCMKDRPLHSCKMPFWICKGSASAEKDL